MVEETTVGGLPLDGDWPSWAESAHVQPMPIRYTTEAMEESLNKMMAIRLSEIKAKYLTPGSKDTAQVAHNADLEMNNITTSVKAAIKHYAFATGFPTPKSCTYDTIGNIKEWGNGGKVCKPFCRVKLYGDEVGTGNPAVLA